MGLKKKLYSLSVKIYSVQILSAYTAQTAFNKYKYVINTKIN